MSRPTYRAATIDDVAAAAGVSRSTASRVLTGTGPASERSSRLVREAAEALGYRANAVAQALAGATGNRIVVAVVAEDDELLHCSYTGRVVASTATVASDHELGVGLQRLALDGARSQLVQLADDRSVRGVILVNTTYDLLEALPQRLQGRVVSIGVGSPQVPAVDVDGAGGTATLARHLLATGRRHPVMVTGPEWLPCTHRPVRAYRDLMEQAGLPARTVEGGFSASAGRRSARQILARWPDTDAVLGWCDDCALGVLAELVDVGVQVPGDVAVTGFDDLPLASVMRPALTTATHPVAAIAAAATRLLLGPAAERARSSSWQETTWFASKPVLRASG
jgi:DNA-binding LacI/PurR family transcriptional regulator